MKLKFLTILFLGIFLILPLVSAFDDSRLIQVCGGDNELLIGCLGDDELIFLSGEVPKETWTGADIGAEHLTIPKEEIPEIEVEEEIIPLWFSILGIDELGIKYSDFMTILVSSLFICMFLMFIYIRKKKKEVKKLKKEKVL